MLNPSPVSRVGSGLCLGSASGSGPGSVLDPDPFLGSGQDLGSAKGPGSGLGSILGSGLVVSCQRLGPGSGAEIRSGLGLGAALRIRPGIWAKRQKV
jgi:hypothetical protein